MIVPSQGCQDFIIAHYLMVICLKDSASAFFIARRCRSIAEMLTERAMLQDVAPSDRVLAGAKNLLLKYALCNLVRQVAQEERNPGCQTSQSLLWQTQTRLYAENGYKL